MNKANAFGWYIWPILSLFASLLSWSMDVANALGQ